MYITQANIHTCRKEITKAWGRSVQTQRDCVALAEAIFEKTNKKVASHTLRRFFGLVAFDGQFRKSTLDTLANYAGHESCDDFLDRLKQEEDLVELLERFIDEHKLLSITAQHWMEESVKKQTELAMAWILAKRGKIAESKATLGVLKDTTFPRDYQGTSRLIIEATEALLQP